MKTKKEAISIINILKDFYSDADCTLDFKNPYEMTIAVMLAAQCTDARVNMVTPALFKKYPNPESLSKADLKDIEKLIHSCGFYKNKAKNAKACSKMIMEKYNGKVPDSMEKLQELPGIGRKCANVIMLEAFHNPQGIAVDTHAKRVSNRVGFSSKKEPEQIEKDLLKVIPKEYYYDVNHLFVTHGREICDSRNPKCDKCPIKDYCNTYKKISKS